MGAIFFIVIDRGRRCSLLAICIRWQLAAFLDRNADYGWDFAPEDFVYRPKQVLMHMKTVCDLHAVGEDLRHSLGVCGCAIPCNNSYLFVMPQPLLQCLSVPSIQNGHGLM